MKRSILLLISVMALLGSCNNRGVDKYDALSNSFDSLFNSLYKDGQPGAAVLLVEGDSIIYDKGFGIADLNTKVPIDGNTFFNIASVSKQFSAVALMILSEEGKLNLDDPVKKWFPDFKADFYNRITLKHLLSHSSGIPDARDRSDRDFVLYSKDEESYSYLKTLDKLNFEPGTSYEYMNPTFQLMYSIVEKASGENFEKFMKERIFDPAGMNTTLYFEDGRSIPGMAHGYIPDSTGGFLEYDYGEESFFATKADGGIYTSTHEFLKWEKALRNNILISESMKNDAHSPHNVIDPLKGEYYGYGWFISKREGYPDKIYHTGDNGGFQIYAARYPSKNILLLIFANRNDKDREQTAEKCDSILKSYNFL